MVIQIVGVPQEVAIMYETTPELCSVTYYAVEKAIEYQEKTLEELLEHFSGSLGVKHWTDNPQA